MRKRGRLGLGVGRSDAPFAYSKDPWVDFRCGLGSEETVRVECQGVLPACGVMGRMPARQTHSALVELYMQRGRGWLSRWRAMAYGGRIKLVKVVDQFAVRFVQTTAS